jgi:hypothetical protein
MPRQKSAPDLSAPGVIEPGVVYRLDEALKRLGWGPDAWRSAKRLGLAEKVISAGGRRFLRGDDLIAFFAELQEGRR